MFTNNLLTRVSMLKQLFFEYNNFLKHFNVKRFENRHFSNPKLRASSYRVDKPFLFQPYVDIISKTLNIPIHFDLDLSVDDIYDQTVKSLIPYSIQDFNWRAIKLDYLIYSAIISWDELFHSDIETTPFTDPNVVSSTFPLNTSAGFPNYGKKRLDINISDATGWLLNFIDFPSYSKIFDNPVTFFRRYTTKLSEDLLQSKTKIRLIWGYPFRISCLEAFFFRKICNNYVNYASLDSISYLAAGKTKLQISKTVIGPIRRFRSDIACADISSFDSSVKSYFDALFFACFHMNYSSYFSNSPNLIRCFKCLLAYTCYTPYVYRSDRSLCKRRGIASGSLQTAAKGTFINRVILNYAFLEKFKGLRSAGDDACCMGDDLIVALKNISFQEICNVYSRFGLTINKSKTVIVPFNGKVEFLGFKWIYPDNAPTQDLAWYVSHLCIPSKYYRELPFPVSVLQTYRAISVVCSLKGGIEMFEFLIGDRDPVWAQLKSDLNSGKNPVISYISRDEKKLFQPVPLRDIINLGWRAF